MTSNKTNPITWAIPDIYKYFQEGQLVIPTYQRGIIWGQDKQQNLMKSVFARLPLGSLLVWQTTAGDRVMYHLIDGLQRTTTILEFLKAPLKYVQVELLGETYVRDLHGALRASTEDEVNEAQVLAELRLWVNSVKSTAGTDGFTTFRLGQRLLDTFFAGEASASVQDRLETPCAAILDAIRQQIAIEDYKIPVIVYEGDEAELPGIFERINSTGTPLSKYQKFAASWAARTTRIASAPIRNSVREKYKQLEDRGFVVADYDPEDPDYEHDLFEYLFGLGKHMAKEHESLLAQSDDITDVESASFSIATITHGLRMGEMPLLPQKFISEGNQIVPEAFEAAALAAFAAVDSIIKPLYRLRLNTKSGAEAKLSIPELQLLSFVSAFVSLRYRAPEFEERSDWGGDWDASFKAPVRQHLLVDLLQQSWRGSGDSTIYSRTWDHPAIGPIVPSDYYKNEVSWEYMDRVLDTWFEESLQSEQRERAPIRAVEKILMRFVYMTRISVADNEDKEFEIDHVLPVKRLLDHIPADEGWPISCIANLTLLEKADNRRKSTQTLKEYVDVLSKEGAHSQVTSIQSLSLHPIGDCDITIAPGAATYTKDAYVAFLKSRWQGIKDALQDVLYG